MADIATLGIKVTTQGAKEAARDLDKLGKEAKDASGQVGGLGKTLATLGVGFIAGKLIGAGLSAIIQNTIEAEKAQSQLQAVLKSTGGAAGLTAQQLNLMAQSLQAVTTFDDEAITGAQSLLLTFTKIGRDVFPDATKAVLDISQALGQDLKSSATQVGKALNDPIKGITALSRVSVAFSQTQKDLIKTLVETGRLADAQRIIIGELSTEFGGSATAAANTLGGAFKQLKNAAGDLLEGDTGGEGLVGIRDAVKDLTRTLNDPAVKAGFQSLIAGLANVAKFAADAIGAVSGLAQATRQAFAADNQKSYNGLLDETVRLQGLIDKGFDKSNATKRLAEVNKLLDAQRQAMRGSVVASQSGGSSGSGNGRGRGVRGTDPIKVDVDPDTEKKSKGRKAALSDEQRASNALADSYLRMNAQLKEQVALYGKTGEEVRLRYQLENGELSKLTAVQKDSLIVQAQRLDQLKAEDEARQKAIQAEQDETDAIKEHQKAVSDLLADIAFETKLLGLSRVEKEKEIALRYANVDAASAEGQAISDAIGNREALAKQAEGLDFVRQSGVDLFTDLTDGAGSAKDAFDDFIDNARKQILKLLAEKLVEKLLGAFGTAGGGQAGGFASVLGAVFGGGRATGGPVSGGKLYEVGERGPELLRSNGRNYMIPGRDGKVEAGSGKSTVKNTTINITVPGNTSKETAAQIAARVSQGLQLAGRDN